MLVGKTGAEILERGDMTHPALLQSQDTPTTVIVIAAIAVGMVLVVTVLFFLSLRRDSRDMRQAQTLIATGEPAQAKILRMWDTGTTLNDDPKLKFLLEVRPSGRDPYQVEIKCYVSHLRLSQVQPGNVIAVKIDRQDDTRIALDLL
jgi:hypothetical protein